VNHDRGLKYQSFPGFDYVIAHDKAIVVYPGQARCGQEPFSEDDQDPGLWGWSWWRSVRGFSGSVIYRAIKKVWSPKTHKEFPPAFRKIVRMLFMAWNRDNCVFHILPLEGLYMVLESMEWDWFGADYDHPYREFTMDESDSDSDD